MVAEGTAGELAERLGDSHSVFEIRTPAGRSRLQAALEDIFRDGVDVIDAGPDRFRIRISASDVSRLVPGLVNRDIEMSELRDLGSDLDDIYHRYFTRSEEVTS